MLLWKVNRADTGGEKQKGGAGQGGVCAVHGAVRDTHPPQGSLWETLECTMYYCVNKSGCCDFNFGSLSLHAGNRKWPHNCDSLTSCNTWCDPLLKPPNTESPPFLFSRPTMWCQWLDTTQRSTLSLSKVKHLRLWFREQVTFSSSASFSIPPFSPHWPIHHADRQCVLTCSLCQPIWAEGEVDKGGEGE